MDGPYTSPTLCCGTTPVVPLPLEVHGCRWVGYNNACQFPYEIEVTNNHYYGGGCLGGRCGRKGVEGHIPPGCPVTRGDNSRGLFICRNMGSPEPCAF